MKRLFYAAACAVFFTCTGAMAQQQRAGSAEGGISPEMLAQISKGYEGTASDKALKNALAGTSIATLAVNSENAAMFDTHKGYHRPAVFWTMLALYRSQCAESKDDR